jgi:two-component sensor histidine kinase
MSASGTIYWDNLLTPLIDAAGQVRSILCISRDVTEKTLLERQLAEGLERERLLAREMQHRIKNLFSVVAGLTLFAEKEAASAGAPEGAMRVLRGKLDALSRASDAVFETGHGKGQPVDLASVVRSVLLPYGARCEVRGPALAIRGDAMTTFALFLHELATNSVKYGALSRDGGRVTVTWVTHGDEQGSDRGDGGGAGLALTWVEAGGPVLGAAPQRKGFGSQMVDRIVQASGGCLKRHWHAQGLRVELFLPGGVKAA